MAQTRINLENQTRDGAIELHGLPTALTVDIFPIAALQCGAYVGPYAGAAAEAVSATPGTNYYWIDDTGALQTNQTGYPTGVPYIQLGTVIVDATPKITAIANQRIFLTSGSSSSSVVKGEVPTQTGGAGELGGCIFTTAYPYAAGSLDVFLNGQHLQSGADYAETTPGSGTFTFAVLYPGDTTAPFPGDVVLVGYTRV